MSATITDDPAWNGPTNNATDDNSARHATAEPTG
jgi:hypothetical protein